MKTLTMVLAGAVLALAGCGSSGGGTTTGASGSTSRGSTMSAPRHTAVKMAGFAFSPARVTVRAGGSVSFSNSDSAPHTATVQGGPTLDTGAVKQGRTRALVFPRAGTYRYVCGFHPYMHGVVVVQ